MFPDVGSGLHNITNSVCTYTLLTRGGMYSLKHTVHTYVSTLPTYVHSVCMYKCR